MRQGDPRVYTVAHYGGSEKIADTLWRFSAIQSPGPDKANLNIFFSALFPAEIISFFFTPPECAFRKARAT